MPILSLDPRVNRLQAEQVSDDQGPVLAAGDHWPSYQVFHQRRRGEKHSSVGIVHAPSSEMAMALAKEQYGRRGETSNLWVVCSADVLEMDYADEDVFRTTPSKSYRDPAGYKVNEKIDAFKAKNQG
ncbi:MAG: 1,2-phenylacetyl-CoA epoxidase subunit B [Cytophagia bacterium]|nr:1,2-phenylacetyl-CoA epoxidase subunit B [Cytophagia bacterium]